MELAALKERVQPALLQDFDAVRAEFVDETGSEDPRAFVRHLRSFALIPAELADSLLAELPGAALSAGGPTGPVPSAPNHPATPLSAPRAATREATPTPAPVSLSVATPDRVKRISMSQPPPADGGVFDDSEGEEVRLPEPSRPIREPSVRVGARAATPPSANPWGPGGEPSPRAATPRTQAGQSAPPPSATPAPSLRVQVARVSVGADPDEDSTTVMQWDDDSGEVDPEAATKHMDRAELYAAMSDHTDLGEIGSLGKAFTEAPAPSPPRPAGAQGPASAIPDPFVGHGEAATSFDDDSADFETDMVDKTDSIQLINPIGVAGGPVSAAFPPDPAPLGAGPAPLAPMDPAAADGPYDPEADTIHVARKVELDARTVIRPLPGGQTPDRAPPERFVAHPPPDRFVGNAPDRSYLGPDEDVADLPDDPTGRYRFVALVAHDGMARTYEATDVAAGRAVWIRLMNDEVVINPVLLRRFKAEARICAMLAHPGIPVVHELRGDYAYVHSPTEGRTLAAVLSEARDALGSRRPLPPDANRDMLIARFLRVCDALSYAHAHGLIHRDLRPENIVLGGHGATWVVDWGIARRLPGTYSPVTLEPVDEDPRLLIGTPGYCSPEQANGNHAALDGRSDVYALGLLLYEILSLRPAVSGVSPAAKLGRQQLGQIEPLVHAFGAPIPRGLVAVVLKALEVHPSDRHPTPDALADEVRRAMRGDDDGWFASAGRAAGRHPGVLLTVGAALGFGWIVALAALVVPWL